MHQILAPFAFSSVSRYMLNVTPLLDSLQGRNSYTLVLLLIYSYHMKSLSLIAVSAFVLVMLALSLAIMIFQYTTFDVLPFPIKEAKAIKHKASSSASPPSSSEGNTIPASSQSSTASPGGCINYNPSKRTITVSCNSPARLTDIDSKLHDASLLAKQSANGVWFLNANLAIAKGATLHIDSTDTKWLKISSKVTRGAGVAKIAPAYIIDVHGSLKIDSEDNIMGSNNKLLCYN